MKRYWIGLAAVLALVVGACEKSPSTGSPGSAANSTEGQGDALTADPQFAIVLKIEKMGELSFAPRQFAIYQSKPAKGDQKEAPQGWEIRGENFTVTGRAPADVKVAPTRKFAMLVGQKLEVRERGGDPTAPSMSKITLSDGRVFVAIGGAVAIEKAFYRQGQYTGVSGTLDVTLQEIKLGDTDDPNNKGDEKVGEPIKATGSFTVRADSFAYEQL